MNQRNEVSLIVVLAYVVGYDCWRQLPSYISSFYYCYNLGFLALLFLIYRKDTLHTTWATIFGKSCFNFTNRAILEYVGFILLVAVSRGIVVLLSPPYVHPKPYPLNATLVSEVLIAPLAEEPIFRGVIMKTLCDQIPGSPWKVILLNNLIWVSAHSLNYFNPASLLVFGTLSALCYLRFRSVVCCIFLHVLWNFCHYLY